MKNLPAAAVVFAWTYQFTNLLNYSLTNWRGEIMAKRTVVTMPGDGIGNQVLPEAIRVLNAVGFDANYVHADIGWEIWCNEGNALPERTVKLLAEHKLGLFGAITSKPKKAADAELKPELQSKGFSYFSPIVTMRQKFDLDICMRPCIGFPGNPLNFIRKKPSGGFDEPQVNAVVFRQNTEGLYAGVEWTNPPQQVRDALVLHAKFKPFANTKGEDLAVSVRIVTRQAAERICRAAFEYAKKFGYKNVTICEKPNVLRETSGLMEEVAKQVAKEYPGIPLWSTNIDAQCMWLTKNPEDYGVVVASNLFGDVISDAFAGLIGGLGFAASGNIGREVAMFEPTHGSAPKYAELKPAIVNPIAMILSAAMMLDHIGEREKADIIRAAIASVVKAGHVRTYDMMRIAGGAKSIAQGAASTVQMTDAILAAVEKVQAAELAAAAR
jgi:isocitrate dehydrogenase (NAD+)